MPVNSKTLLLVEDEAIIALEEARLLTEEGYAVVQAFSGAEAIDIVKKKSREIDLILMDIDLGRGMDGTAAAREILKDHDIPVVFLSSHTEKEIVEKTETITSYGYVVKNTGIIVLDASIKMAFKLFEAHRGIRVKSMEVEAVNEELNSTIEEMEAANEELTRSQKVIMESEERYHVLFDNMLNGFALLEIVLDKNGVPADFRFLVVNPAFEALTGMKAQEIKGRTGRELFPNLEGHWIERYGRVAMTGEPVNFENYSRDLDRWFAITAFSPLKGQVAVMFEHVTERRRTEEALRESERMLRRAQEISRLGHFKFNSRTNVVEGSDELFRIFGLSREEFQFPDFIGSVHPGDRDFVGSTIGNSIAKGLGYDIEHRLLLRDGTIKYIRAIGEPMKDDEGATAFMVGTVQDITDRKRSEEALKGRDSLIAAISNNLPSAMIYQVVREADGRRRFTYVSDTVRTFYGCSPEEAMADAGLIYGRVAEEDRGRIIREEEAANAALAMFKSEARMIGPDGSVRWSRFISTPERLVDGVTRWDGIEIDITERKRLEEERRESEERFRRIFEDGPMGIAIVGPDFHFRTANSAFCSILGYGETELRSITFREITHPDHLNTDTENVAALIRGEIPIYRTDKRYIRGDGSVIWAKLTLSPVRDQHGKFVHFIVLLEDITERKNIEDKLRESQEIFRLFMEYSPIYVFFKDEKIRAIQLSRNYEKMLGMPVESALGKTMDDLFPSDLAKGMIRDDQRILAEGKPLEISEEHGGRTYSTIKFPIIRDGKPPLLAGFTIDVTDKIESEKALRASETKYRTLFENDLTGDFIINADGTRLIDCNRAYVEIFGFTDRESALTGKELLHPADTPERLRMIDLVRRDGFVRNFECTRHRRDGSIIHIVQNLMGMFDGNGVFKGVFGYVLDITERKKAEEALSLSEERFRRMVASVTDYIYTVRIRDGKPVATSHGPACQNVTGYSPGDYEADPGLWYRMVHEEDRDMVQAQAAGMLSGEGAGTIEHRIIHRDGSIRWVRNTPVLLRDGQGRPMGYDGLIVDITERKRAEERLRVSEKRWKQLFETNMAVKLIIDPHDGRIVDANTAACGFYGFDRDTLLSMKISDINCLPVEDVRSEMELASKKAKLYFQFRHRIASGEIRDVEVYSGPIETPEGTLLHSIIHDITERKMAEEELVRSAHEKDVLMRELQHRVKNSLGVIKGLLSLEMQNLSSDEHSRGVFQDAMDRIQSMSAIYEQLNSTSSSDRVDLKQYVGDIARRLFETYVLDSGKIGLSLKLDDAVLDVRRTVPLGLILNELITNALKYAYPAGKSGELRVSLVKEGGDIILEVSDDGPGLPDDVLAGKTAGLGIRLVEMLAEQIEATLVLEGKRGTAARISFNAAGGI